jgi:hypothetical protein
VSPAEGLVAVRAVLPHTDFGVNLDTKTLQITPAPKVAFDTKTEGNPITKHMSLVDLLCRFVGFAMNSS